MTANILTIDDKAELLTIAEKLRASGGNFMGPDGETFEEMIEADDLSDEYLAFIIVTYEHAADRHVYPGQDDPTVFMTPTHRKVAIMSGADAENIDRVEAIYHQVLEFSPAQRRAFDFLRMLGTPADDAARIVMQESADLGL